MINKKDRRRNVILRKYSIILFTILIVSGICLSMYAINLNFASAYTAR